MPPEHPRAPRRLAKAGGLNSAPQLGREVVPWEALIPRPSRLKRLSGAASSLVSLEGGAAAAVEKVSHVGHRVLLELSAPFPRQRGESRAAIARPPRLRAAVNG